MPQYRSKPECVEAERFQPSIAPLPFHDDGVCCLVNGNWFIDTGADVGDMQIDDGDYILKFNDGTYSVCDPVYFADHYEVVK